VEQLGYAGMLHDLGKSKIDTAIINKKSMLSDIEIIKIREHPEIGYKLAKELGISNEKILNAIRHHHERLDGSGYPNKIRSHEINIYAKIISICDVFDALTTKRSYKDALGTFEAFKLMKLEKYHFDNELLKKFIKLFVK